MRPRLLLVCKVLVAAMIGATACGDLLGEIESSDVDGGATSDAATSPDGQDADGGGDANAETDGRWIVVVPGAGGYAINSAEITVGEYGEFARETASFDAGIAECAWKKSFEPSGCTPSAAASAPMTCVDWCAAATYCAWSGGRLCGAMGSGGPRPVALYAYDDPTTDEWTNACTGRLDSQRWSFGTEADAAVCNTSERALGGPMPANDLQACVGGIPGLLNMTGNVWEWENACADGGTANDACTFRGGGWSNDLAAARCGSATFLSRGLGTNYLGFRCCRSLER